MNIAYVIHSDPPTDWSFDAKCSVLDSSDRGQMNSESAQLYCKQYTVRLLRDSRLSVAKETIPGSVSERCLCQRDVRLRLRIVWSIVYTRDKLSTLQSRQVSATQQIARRIAAVQRCARMLAVSIRTQSAITWTDVCPRPQGFQADCKALRELIDLQINTRNTRIILVIIFTHIV